MELKKGKNAIPSIDEQIQLQQSASQISLSLLNLQVTELLAEVKNDALYKKTSVNEWLEAFCTSLRGLEADAIGEPLTKKWLKKVNISGIRPVGPVPSMSFLPPSAVSVVGSLDAQTSTIPFVNIDIACSMPDSLFEER